MLEDIETFCAIAKVRSLSGAANELNLSASVVTRRLARLEDHLKARLFERTTRSLMITEAGQRYYDSVYPLLQSLKLAESDIRNSEERVCGLFKVGLPVSISNSYVSPNLDRLLDRYPEMNIQIVNGNHLLNFLDNGFCCVIHCGSIPDTSFYSKKITTWRKVLCASPDYLAKYGNPQTLSELKEHNCLDHLDNLSHTWHLNEGDKKHSVLVKGNLAVNSSIDLCQLAVSGLGAVS